MKVTYLYQYFGTPKGSWSTRVYELTRRWAKKGVDVTVITAPYDKSDIKPQGFVSTQIIQGVKIIIINSGDSNQYSIAKRVYRALIFALVSTYYTLKIKSDINIASSGPITIAIPALVARLFKSTPYVFEVRDLWPDGGIGLGLIKNRAVIKISLWFERVCYNFSAFVVPCSDGMDHQIKIKSPKVDTLVIPNACDLKLFKESHCNNFIFPEWVNLKDKIFIYAGSLGLMDSCIEIIDGFHFLKEKKNVKIVFIGGGSEKILLENMVTKYGYKNQIHFTGLIPKNEVVEWYKISRASFVVFKDYPVLGTSSPNKMFDSFAAGVPIIQNTKGWIFDLVENSKCGLNVIPNSASSMAKAIKRMIDDDDFAEQASLNSFDLAKNKFNRSILAKQYLDKINYCTK
jgi:glycosyltransferase involved in cell wall biosynthesis